MATFDLTPLYHATIGFDRVSRLLGEALERENAGFPPYNIEKTGDDAYRIVMALAGYSKDDLEISTENNRLVVRGAAKGAADKAYLHQGIAQRGFQRVFDLADYVVVTEAAMADGLLTIELRRELPEQLKPRTIAIGASPRQISAPVNEKQAA
jgi:molecular chaperone IbpA